jgi:hypothetical protein
VIGDPDGVGAYIIDPVFRPKKLLPPKKPFWPSMPSSKMCSPVPELWPLVPIAPFPIANEDGGDGALQVARGRWSVDPATLFGKSCSQSLLVALLSVVLLFSSLLLGNLLIRWL